MSPLETEKRLLKMLDDMHNPKLRWEIEDRAIINHTNSDIDKISLQRDIM